MNDRRPMIGDVIGHRYMGSVKRLKCKDCKLHLRTLDPEARGIVSHEGGISIVLNWCALLHPSNDPTCKHERYDLETIFDMQPVCYDASMAAADRAYEAEQRRAQAAFEYMHERAFT